MVRDLDNEIPAGFLKHCFYSLHFVPGFAAGAETNKGCDVLGGKTSGDIDSAGGESKPGAADHRYVVLSSDADDVTYETIVTGE